MQEQFDWKKYFIVFIITLFLFASAGYLSSYFNNRKLDQLKTIQDKISTDILSSETEFSLLQDLACTDTQNSILSDELESLGNKITFSEENIGKTDDQVVELRKFYTLLEIKDYLLQKKISDRCSTTNVSILYFYTTRDNCSECTKQGYVLTALRDKYPGLRVYSFDFNLDLSALKALLAIYKIEDTKLPAIIIGDKKYTGFQSIEDIEKNVPDLVKLLPVEDATTVESNKIPSSTDEN